MKIFRKFLKNEEGATAIEYGLIAALISVAMVGAAGTLGTQIGTTFGDVEADMAGASGSSGG